MAVKIRLRRVGAKKQPSYRIVVADARSPRDGRFIETIGYYNPLTDPPTIVIDNDRATYWMRQGAQPTDVVKYMIAKSLRGELGTPAVTTRAQVAEAVVAEAPVAEEVVTAEVVVAEEVAPVAEEAAATEVAVVEETPAAEVAPAE